MVTRVAKVDRVCAGRDLQVINPAEEIVQVAMDSVCGTWRIDVYPSTGNQDSAVFDFEVIKETVGCPLDHGY